jgi:hypothetical protein
MRRKDIRTLGLIDIWTLGCQEFHFLPLRGVRLGEKRGDIGHIYCYTTYEGGDLNMGIEISRLQRVSDALRRNDVE